MNSKIKSNINNRQFSDVSMNCLIDLHLHLDGSLSLKTVKELAKFQKIEIPENDDELIKILRVSEGCKDLNEYLEKFEFPLKLLQTREAITQSVYDLQEKLKKQGLIYAEIRFAPQLHLRGGLTQDEVVQAAVEGLDRSDFRSGLILCCMRGSDNLKENLETVSVAEKYLHKGVCAIDLAGAEALYNTGKFKSIFDAAVQKNIPFTIHAGEADGPESIKTALEYGASRIGHGVRSVEDPSLIKRLVSENITLELCPTSNLNTNIYRSINEYPIRTLLDAGVSVTVNTDNMTVSNVTARGELQLVARTFKLSDNEIKDLLLESADASFADTQTKIWLKDRINKEI